MEHYYGRDFGDYATATHRVNPIPQTVCPRYCHADYEIDSKNAGLNQSCKSSPAFFSSPLFELHGCHLYLAEKREFSFGHGLQEIFADPKVGIFVVFLGSLNRNLTLLLF
jgi:hypothetical protein